MNTDKDYYQLLHVRPDASDAEIRANYRKLLKVFHPDKEQEYGRAAETTRELVEAYETLSDPHRRREYDRARRDRVQASQAGRTDDATPTGHQARSAERARSTATQEGAPKPSPSAQRAHSASGGASGFAQRFLAASATQRFLAMWGAPETATRPQVFGRAAWVLGVVVAAGFLSLVVAAKVLGADVFSYRIAYTLGELLWLLPLACALAWWKRTQAGPQVACLSFALAAVVLCALNLFSPSLPPSLPWVEKNKGAKFTDALDLMFEDSMRLTFKRELSKGRTPAEAGRAARKAFLDEWGLGSADVKKLAKKPALGGWGTKPFPPEPSPKPSLEATAAKLHVALKHLESYRAGDESIGGLISAWKAIPSHSQDGATWKRWLLAELRETRATSFVGRLTAEAARGVAEAPRALYRGMTGNYSDLLLRIEGAPYEDPPHRSLFQGLTYSSLSTGSRWGMLFALMLYFGLYLGAHLFIAAWARGAFSENRRSFASSARRWCGSGLRDGP